MVRSGTGRSGLRAITAVVALYAFVLQIILGGLLPAQAMGPFDVLCSQAAVSGATEDDPGPGHPVQHQACCTAATLAVGTQAPNLVATDVAWPPRRAASVVWQPEIRLAARAPPGVIAHPRGPPAV